MATSTFNTSSLSFPNMLNVSRNLGAVAIDNAAIVNRVKLLLLTEPTELYHNPTYGVGLKRYLYQYNNDSIIGLIKDRVIEQLSLWEPCVIAEQTQVVSGLTFTGDPYTEEHDYNHLKLTITLITKFGDELKIESNDLIK